MRLENGTVITSFILFNVHSADTATIVTMTSAISRLVRLIDELVENDGDEECEIPGIRMSKSRVKTGPQTCLLTSGLCMVLQGDKSLQVGNESYQAGAGYGVMSSTDLPIKHMVTRADVDSPYLGIWVELDLKTVARLSAEVSPGARTCTNRQCLMIEPLDAGLLEALGRLLGLLHTPELREPLIPLIKQEIIVRLLNGPQGPLLRQLVAQGSNLQRINAVLAQLRQNFSAPVDIAELANLAHMSQSSFRQHFRIVTGMSPLQYLKQMRLLEARQLMLNQELDAATAGLRVGYESSSQFNREYARFFGEPPLRDIKRLRAGEEVSGLF